ncbi:hypothetical protein [Bremerella sp. P1]|uniref:hypothetical protein n=1 Tax=Bremerella sp. P1 TaxID=3026424 RepID=UPI00236748FD|nr:hypothetical protein [Bremerella sp. P1]WDI43681.1 hypothetical protein PSR63_06940 [Bremerella sp. P1]
MSSANARPDPSRSFSQENAPQVIVRAGKTFVCSACGTMVEIPADVVGQLVLATSHPPQDEPATREASNPAESPQPSPTLHTERNQDVAVVTSPRSAEQNPRPKRPQQPKRTSFVGETIDGLRVPASQELDRALAWGSFHLKMLDRQGSEIKRLQKLLKQRSSGRTSCPRPPAPVKEIIVEEACDLIPGATQEHAQADLGVAPVWDTEKERGPP